MADVEEEGEFGSHFLDSMLEIEMTEVDGEVDILKNESPHIENSRVLPPIPTFDLQSQTLLYRNTYRNSLGHPRLPNPPVVTSTVPKVFPLVSSVPVLKPSPMLTIYSKNLLPPQNSPVVTKSNPSVQKFCSKSNIKNPLKIHKSTAVSEQMVRTKFLKQVFRAEYIKNVFIKKDEPSDISQFGKEEMEFYKTCFKGINRLFVKILMSNLKL